MAQPVGAELAATGRERRARRDEGTALGSPTPVSRRRRLRRAILIHLRQAGPSSPDTVASALEASRTGVLQQLHALEAAGLVSHAAEKHGVGRPRHVYDVTADAQGLFPTDYGGFASGLVKAIEAVGGDDLVDAGLRRAAPPDRRSHPAPDGRAAARRREPHRPRASSSRSSRTRPATWPRRSSRDDGSLRLQEHNCAIDKIARRTQAALRRRAGPLPRAPRPGRHPRVPHRLGRPLLHLRRGAGPARLTLRAVTGRDQAPAVRRGRRAARVLRRRTAKRSAPGDPSRERPRREVPAGAIDGPSSGRGRRRARCTRSRARGGSCRRAR